MPNISQEYGTPMDIHLVSCGRVLPFFPLSFSVTALVFGSLHSLYHTMMIMECTRFVHLCHSPFSVIF